MRKKQKSNSTILSKDVLNPIWISVSQAANIGGVKNKTVRRAIQANKIKYIIVKNRYQIDLASFIIYLHTKTKLKNKLNQYGIGQYINKWRV